MMTLLTKTGLRWIWLAVLAIVLDQITKLAIMQHIPYGHGVYVTSFFNLVHVYNLGAAFSFLAGAEGWQRRRVDVAHAIDLAAGFHAVFERLERCQTAANALGIGTDGQSSRGGT